MSRKKYYAILFMTCCITMMLFSYNDLRQLRNREGIILSPDKTKSVEFHSGIGTQQILVNFHRMFLKGGSNVVSGNFDNQDIEVEWVDNHKLIIKHRSGVDFGRKEQLIYFMTDSIIVDYVER